MLGILQLVKHDPCSRETASPKKTDTKRDDCSVMRLAPAGSVGVRGKLPGWDGCLLSQALENKQVLTQQKRGGGTFWPAGMTQGAKSGPWEYMERAGDSHCWVRRASEIRCYRKVSSAMLRCLGFIP